MTGTYEHSIDAKGRLFIPAKLRGELGETFYLAVGVDACLAIYPQSTWDKITEKIAALPMSQSKTSWSPPSCANMRGWRRIPSSSV